MTTIDNCLDQIAKFNTAIGNTTTWKVVPELCFVQVDEEETTFCEDAMKIARLVGKLDTTQSPEECGAVGTAYLVNRDEFIDILDRYQEHLVSQHESNMEM